MADLVNLRSRFKPLVDPRGEAPIAGPWLSVTGLPLPATLAHSDGRESGRSSRAHLVPFGRQETGSGFDWVVAVARASWPMRRLDKRTDFHGEPELAINPPIDDVSHLGWKATSGTVQVVYLDGEEDTEWMPPAAFTRWAQERRTGGLIIEVYSVHYPSGHPTWATLWSRNYSKIGWVPRTLAERFCALAHHVRQDDWVDYKAPDGRVGLMAWFDCTRKPH